MAKNDGEGQGKAVQLQVAVKLISDERRERPDVTVYAYSSGGKLLAQSNPDKEGHATLTLERTEATRSLRVLVGPRLEQPPGLADLLRRGAEERHLRLEPDLLRPKLEIAVIPDRWLCWLRGLCFVRGTLLKRTTSGGVSVDLPVCDATVEIYEVDPLFIILPRLPDLGIERLRELILNPPLPEPPFPLEPPGPFPPPGPDPAFRFERVPVAVATRTAEAVPRAGELQMLARTTSTAQLRQALLDHAVLVRPLLCRFFPTAVTMQLVATATTDECGHFRTFFFRGCNNPDTPDLYFKAKQRIFPAPFPPLVILAPTPVACHTRWNYACGSEVTLYTSHPLAITCSPCPPVSAEDNWVLVMAVGNHPLSRIRGTSSALQATTNPGNLGLTDLDAPWGGLLRLRLEFDNSLRESLGVKYYQVSWRPGNSGAFQPLSGEVHRHYARKIGSDLALEVYPLGPKVVGGTANLFEIPPALPPTGQWSLPDVVEGTTNAKFPTTVLVPAAQHGKVQLKVDLFDATGGPVNIAAKGIKYVVPTSTDLSGTIQTEDTAALGLVVSNSFIMTLHVDNNNCGASIAAPTRNGIPASPNCGVLEYDPTAPGTVVMDYSAHHPNLFASHSFAIVRGVSSVVSVGGPVPGSPPVIETVAALLGGCAVAGFSENLYVAATATDGWRRLSEYDRSAVRAFVLAPQEN